ncbi:acyl-CoA synthetase FdrA [Synergistaceae bacterium OttesenSCG-928-I11]|nr:acyl-CoA synthetase FdrA [Synergistaceae bacterium OttesenSCG-928-I11]
MALTSRVFPNAYRDSVLLMKIASNIRSIPGVLNAEVVIATEANKSILEFNGLLTDEIRGATPNDLVLSVNSEDESVIDEAIARSEELIFRGFDCDKTDRALYTAKSVAGALAMEPDANLAILSIPGPFVRREAEKLLENGINLLVFSDNVSASDELEMKKMADERGLLVMGPDCGTAIIGGTALAFANNVRRGNIGMVCASGTGLQEVATIISNHGGGISHAVGTGGNDVSDKIGGRTMKQGLRLLEGDPGTDIIVVVSKPPGTETMASLSKIFERCRKPMVVNFLGRGEPHSNGDVFYTATLEESAQKALQLAGVETAVFEPSKEMLESEKREISFFSKGERYLRALYTGGTLATEAAIVCRGALDGLTANIKVPGVKKMEDPMTSAAHCIVDLGADEFTLGKPHPMIDPEMKNRRLVEEARDPQAAVLLLDFVLGYGVNPDPAGATIASLSEARRIAEAGGRHLAFIASVTGTDDDPQERYAQVKILRENGVLVYPTNAQAVRAALRLVEAIEGRE